MPQNQYIEYDSPKNESSKIVDLSKILPVSPFN